LSTFNYGATTAPTSLSLVGGAATGASITGSGTFSLGGNVTVFDATTGSSGATISCPVSLGSTRTFTIADDGTTAADLTMSGQISGAAGIIKTGSGTMVLSGGNTFSGTTTISTGILNVQNIAGLGTTAGGTTVSSGAELQFQGGIAVGAEPLTLVGSGTLGSSGGALYNVSGNNSFSGAITLTEATRINSLAGSLTLSGTVDLAGFTLIIQGASTNANLISGVISSSGTGAIQKVGAGKWALSGTNTFTGGVQLLNGTLDIRNASALGTTAGTFAIGGVGNTVTIDNGSGSTLTTSNYPISLSDNFTFTGTSSLNLGTGTVTISADRTISVTANTLTIGGTINDNTKSLTKTGSGNLSFGSQAVTLKDLTISAGTLTSTSNTLTLVGAYSNSGTFTHNSGTVSFAGTSAQTIAGTTTFNNLTINNSAGVSASANQTVSGNLVLSSANPSASVGALDMGSNELTMVGSTTGQGDVSGIITRTSIAASTDYTFGNQYTSFAFTSGGTLPSSVSVQVNLANPSWKTNAINRYYSVIQTGGTTGCKVSMRLHYLQSELNGVNENGVMDFYDIHGGVTIHDHGYSAKNSTDNWLEIINLSVTYIAPSSSSYATKNWTIGQSTSPNFTWIGPVSTDWNDADNWSGGVPSDTSDVIIPDASTTDFDPTTTTASVKSISIASGGILNGGGTLTVAKSSGTAWTNDGGTFNPGSGTIEFTGSGATMGGTTTFNNVTVASGASLQLSSGAEMKIAGTLTLTGSLDATSFDNTVEFNNASGGQTINAINYHNLKVSNTSGTTTISGTVGVYDLFTPGSQAYTVTGSTVNFNGNGAGQNIPAFTFNNLGISNSSKSLTGAVTVNGTLTLTSGIVTTTTSNLLTMASGSSLSGGSSTAFIYGPMRKIGNTDFTFPIGKDSGYARVGITNISGSSSDYFTVEYFSDPYTNATLGSGLTSGRISRKEFWEITPNNNSLSANVTLYWENGTFSGIRSAPSDTNLVVAHFNGSNWGSVGNTNLTGSASAGSVTSSTISSWSPFTFGSPNGLEPLPVKLVSFTAKTVASNVLLNWATASENGNAYFEIERSTDGINFIKVGQVKGSDNSAVLVQYKFTDFGALKMVPMLFYRLNQVDYSGLSEKSDVITVRAQIDKGANILNQLPNPFAGNLSITYSLPEAGDVVMNIVDATGRTIRTNIISGNDGINVVTFDTNDLPQGIYLVTLYFNGIKYVSSKVIKL
jgi:autotransporter-associated beta strand protein